MKSIVIDLYLSLIHISNEKWAADGTEFEIPMSNKKLYLSAIIDLYDRAIVA